MALRKLPQRLQAKAEEELYEDPKTIQVDLDVIKKWLKDKPHVKVRTDDQWLLSFLRGCKFDLERMKETLDAYCKIRKSQPEFFNNRDPFSTEVREILNLGFFLPLLKTESEDSPRIILARVGPSKFKLPDIIKVALMICEVLLNEDDQFVVSGAVVLLDLKDVKETNLEELNPTTALNFVNTLQKVYPIRIKTFHFFNIPNFFGEAFALFEPHLKNKFLGKMVIHRGDDVEKVVPKSILPVECGGESGRIQDIRRHWQKKVESYREWFEQDGKLGKGIKKKAAPKATCTAL